MRAAFGLLAVALVALGAYYIFFRETPIRNYPSAGTDIIALGDSLVDGVGAPEGQGFVDILSQRTAKPIINLGTSGDTSAEVLARMSELDRYKPKVVILLVGGNDYLQRVPREETFENLRKIITNIQGRGSTVLLLGVRGGVLADNFASGYENLADTHQTAYVSNVLDGLLGNEAYMYDRVHPNAAGYQRIAERVYPELAKLLK